MTPTPLFPFSPTQLPAGWVASAGLHQAAEQIWLACSREWPDLSVEVLTEVDSTNSELVRRAREGRAERVLLVAERQTAGRGRLGRSWQTEATPALTLSLGLPMAPRDWSGLSLVVGLVLAQQLGHGVGVKWPNDLWWQGRKLCGILIETAGSPALDNAPHPQGTTPSLPARYVVIGAGINLATPTQTDLRTPPVGLGDILAQAASHAAPNAAALAEAADTLDLAAVAMARVLPPLLAALRVFEREGFAPFEDAYAQLDVLRSQRVSLSDGRLGVCLGVDARGAMHVLCDGDAAPQAIETGEISVRPLAP